MHSERRPALIDILCNNSIAEDCRKRSPLLFEAQTTRTPAAAKTGSECCVRDPRGTLPGIVEVPLCGKETPVNELEQVVDSKPAAQHLPLPNALQHCVATGHLSISAQATAVPLSEQLHLDHSYQGHYPGCMYSAGRRQLGACRSNAQAAEQHAPALSELQTSGRDRTGSRAMQLMQSRLQHSSSKQKQRKTAVCPTRTLPCARPKKQQKVLVLGAGQGDRHLHAQRSAPKAHVTGMPSNFNYYDHGHGCWDSEMAGVEGMSGMGLDMWEGVGTVTFGGGFGPQ